MSQQDASDRQPVVSMLSLVYDGMQVKQHFVTMLQTGGMPVQVMLAMPQHVAHLKADLNHFFLLLYSTELHALSLSAFNRATTYFCIHMTVCLFFCLFCVLIFFTCIAFVTHIVLLLV